MNSSPWAKLTTSMMPKISVRPEATSARIMPVTMPLIVWIRIRCSSGRSIGHTPRYWWMTGSFDAQLGGRGVVAHHALFHDVDPLARLEGQRHVLLDQQHRDPFALAARR